ncbi:MAG: hypothetical protein AAF211_32190 [Myxococcota bacterium]
MQRLSLLAVTVAATLICRSAEARVSEVSFGYVQGDVAEACAVQVTIETVEDNLVNLSETLTLDGLSWATFAQIEPAIDSIRRGDSVLFASPTFEGFGGIAADVALSDADCAKITGGHTIGFLGSFGDDAGSITIPSGITLNSAFDGSMMIDLSVDSFDVSSLNDSVTLGVAAAFCGCRSTAPLSSGFPLLVATALLALRRRRCRA